MYELELHESKEFNNYYITRVPGGWIYRYSGLSDSKKDLFVPYSDEFNNKKYNNVK